GHPISRHWDATQRNTAQVFQTWTAWPVHLHSFSEGRRSGGVLAFCSDGKNQNQLRVSRVQLSFLHLSRIQQAPHPQKQQLSLQ
ncbi:hypothetical protein GOODEAATRI_015337, partial [Goodea atripinnis]